MGTHPIFESDFDCLTDQTMIRAARYGDSVVRAKQRSIIQSDFCRMQLTSHSYKHLVKNVAYANFIHPVMFDPFTYKLLDKKKNDQTRNRHKQLTEEYWEGHFAVEESKTKMLLESIDNDSVLSVIEQINYSGAEAVLTSASVDDLTLKLGNY